MRPQLPARTSSFDAVASLGAVEHFCSPEQYEAGVQEERYRGIFERIAELLPGGGRLFVQTMVFGPNMIPAEEITIDAPRHSDGWYVALMGKQFPGSWLPFGAEQVIDCAEPHFAHVSSVSGGLDYLGTIRRWRESPPLRAPGSR
ncbi:MAG: class I SAM-dependent methyltransferase [Solirubrobacterales bacterium]